MALTCSQWVENYLHPTLINCFYITSCERCPSIEGIWTKITLNMIHHYLYEISNAEPSSRVPALFFLYNYCINAPVNSFFYSLISNFAMKSGDHTDTFQTPVYGN